MFRVVRLGLLVGGVGVLVGPKLLLTLVTDVAVAAAGAAAAAAGLLMLRPQLLELIGVHVPVLPLVLVLEHDVDRDAADETCPHSSWATADLQTQSMPLLTGATLKAEPPSN